MWRLPRWRSPVTRGKGWLPDDPRVVAFEENTRHVTGLVGAVTAASNPSPVNFCHLLPKNPSQGGTSSCVGQALIRSVWLNACLDGFTLPWLSAKLPYDFARLEDAPYVTMVDDGCRPIAAIRNVVDNGLVSEDAWPLTEENVNVAPPLDIYKHALEARVTSYYRIARGHGCVTLIRRALSLGYCPIFAMPVDEAFEQWTGFRAYPGRTGPSLGGHMQCIAGWDSTSVYVISSWGFDHGENGIVRIENDYMESDDISDVIVPEVVPTQVAA